MVLILEQEARCGEHKSCLLRGMMVLIGPINYCSAVRGKVRNSANTPWGNIFNALNKRGLVVWFRMAEIG